MPKKRADTVINVSVKSFMTLKDFLLVGRVDNANIVDEYNTGPEWIKMYEAAKKQFLAYGLNPPVGTFVTTIRSGIGGPCGLLKKITGIETYGDKEFFILDRAENSQENISYLVDKLLWWAYFAVIPENEQKKHKEPESIL